MTNKANCTVGCELALTGLLCMSCTVCRCETEQPSHSIICGPVSFACKMDNQAAGTGTCGALQQVKWPAGMAGTHVHTHARAHALTHTHKCTCLSISKSMAFCMAENEFMFLTSTLVPNCCCPNGLTDTFTSHRIDPSCTNVS